MAGTLGELHTGEHRGTVGRRPRRAHPGEAGVTLGGWASGRMGGQFGVPLSLFGSLANLGSPIRTIWLFGFLSNGPNGPFPGRLLRGPLRVGQAGMDRPRGHASPVARAPKPRASRPLVGVPAGGLRWGQKWGEVGLPAARVPAAALGAEMKVAGSAPDPWTSGPKQPPGLAGQPHGSPALRGSLLTPPPARPRPARLPGGLAELQPPGAQTGCRGAGTVSPRGEGRTPRVRGRRPPAPARWSPSSHIRSPFPPGGRAAGGPSWWPPSTFLTPGETPPHPSPTPQGLRGPATVPRGQAGQWPVSIPLVLLQGVLWPAPQGGSTLNSAQATGTD